MLHITTYTKVLEIYPSAVQFSPKGSILNMPFMNTFYIVFSALNQFTHRECVCTSTWLFSGGTPVYISLNFIKLEQFTPHTHQFHILLASTQKAIAVAFVPQFEKPTKLTYNLQHIAFAILCKFVFLSLCNKTLGCSAVALTYIHMYTQSACRCLFGPMHAWYKNMLNNINYYYVRVFIGGAMWNE